MTLRHFSLLVLSIACQQIWVVYGCAPNCTKVDSNMLGNSATELICDAQTINLCKMFSSWKVARISRHRLILSGCKEGNPTAGDQLLLFVSTGKLYNYGKYNIMTVKNVTFKKNTQGATVCYVVPTKQLHMSLQIDRHTCLIAQTFPYFLNVSMHNKCILTCDARNDTGLGGILAFRAKSLFIDETSKIEMSGKGFRGGAGGDVRGGGGHGGETFFCPAKEPNMGKAGDISGAAWATNTDGIGGGGAGDGPAVRTGSKGGPGGRNAGGGGGDSKANSDDGAAGGGGGGHFSGGGGGGGGSGCRGNDGGKGGEAGMMIGTYAGGGGQSSCPGGNGGDGGKAGDYALNKAPHCYDKTAQGGNVGSATYGGGGGDSCGNHYGGGGGGGGLQFGNTAIESRLSYGGGGGGGGGSAVRDDPYPGGRGGNGGGLVYLQLNELMLNGKILAEGELGHCLSKKSHRSAPGGSGAGGSVVILTNALQGNPKDKISTIGGKPVKCGFGAGGGGGGGFGQWFVKLGQTTLSG